MPNHSADGVLAINKVKVTVLIESEQQEPELQSFILNRLIPELQLNNAPMRARHGKRLHTTLYLRVDEDVDSREKLIRNKER